METHVIHDNLQRFPGKNGWYYLPLGKRLCATLGPEVRSTWPALKKVDCTLGKTTWTGTIMPIKDGPLFIALPAKVRKAESLDVGDRISMRIAL